MKRDRTIDFVKILLVTGMVIAHSIQLLCNTNSRFAPIISNYINLITFSGFMFCFGYAANIAYLKKSKNEVIHKLLKNFIKLLIIFYISGFGYEQFVSKNLSILEMLRILLLFRIPGYSEFLASFFILNLVILIFFEQLKKIIKNNKLLLIAIIISLLSTYIPYRYININQIGLIFGSEKFACFPILQYLYYFLLGAYFQEKEIDINFKYIGISVLMSTSYIIYVIINKQLPLRFPPSLLWIVGGSLFVYIYYLISIYVSKNIKTNSKVYFIGENTIYFLLISNLSIFALTNVSPKFKINLLTSIFIGIVILSYNYIIIFLVKKLNLKKGDIVNFIKKIMKKISTKCFSNYLKKCMKLKICRKKF